MREYEKYWLKKGTELNHKYEILDVIDEGGMGIVYLGFDKILQQKVSIKEYFPRRYAMRMNGEKAVTIYKGNSTELFEKGLSKFVNEARTLAHFEALDSIVMVKDFFYENQTAYMVMEFPHNNMMYHCIFLLCFCFIANSHSFCANTSLLLRLFACNPQNILNLFHGHVKIRGKLCHTEIHVIAVGEFLDGVF